MAVQDRNLWNLASCILKIADEGFGECLSTTSHILHHRLCITMPSDVLKDVVEATDAVIVATATCATPRVLPFDIIAYYPINSYVTRVILLFSLS
jgi:hypothetical protein